MPATSPPTSARPRSTWSSRLWILAGLLGATTIYSTAVTIHEGTQRGLALGLVTQATAMHLATLASARLERLALEGFAPQGPLAASDAATPDPRATPEFLAKRQRDGRGCACRELLPVSHFFRYDVPTNRLTVVPADSTGNDVAPPPAIADLARAEAAGPRGTSDASSRLVAGRELQGRGAVVLVQRDDRGTPLAVYGMVVDPRETLAMIFARQPNHAAFDSSGLARLDSLSLEVRNASGDRLFGALGSGRAHAIARLGGALRGLELTMAISPSGVAPPLMQTRSELQMLHIGVLLAATILVLVLAFTASRRELLLARARSDFIAGVSHDLRMPLAQILIASETLSMQRERNDGERVSLASSIVRETRRLVGLVDNVLLFSRSGALALKPVLRPVSVAALFEEVVDAVRLSVEDAGQTIEASSTPVAGVMADRRLVRQALVNLVDNALKYGGPGQHIRLHAEQVGTTTRLYVDDEGPGIPKAERDRIFEAYARLEHDQVSERTGTGLGLAVVRQIAEASGGRVWLEDAPGRGARAIIELRAATLVEPAEVTPVVARA